MAALLAYQNLNRQALNYLSNSLRQMSSNGNSYVKQARLLQKLKYNNELPKYCYGEGDYLLLTEKQVFVSFADKASNHQITWVPFNGLTKFLPDLAEQAVLLQVVREKCLFALDVTSLSENIQNQVEKKLNGKFINLRKSLFTLSAEESVLVSQGKSLLSWVKSNCFCPTCGGELVLRGAGRAHKECGSCKSVQYPTISPVGIVLVTDIAHTNALLVRQPVHPPGMYTCIAGFVEVGESVEENVKREVAEEVGLEVVDIKYFGSQHWAFPASRLMIGCLATVSEHQFSLDRSELEDAAWFTPQEVKGALNRVSDSRESVFAESKELWVPPRGAIAHTLLKHWIATHHSDKL